MASFGEHDIAESESDGHAYQLHGPIARQLADLYGVRSDLAKSLSACQRIKTLQKVHPIDSELISMLWASAVISYGRCFSSGVRLHIGKDIVEHLTNESAQTHQNILDIRNKHVAHSVNSQEHNVTVFRLYGKQSGKAGLIGVGAIILTQVDAQGDQVSTLAQLVDEIIKIIEGAAECLRSKIETELNKFTTEELHEAAPLSFRPSTKLNYSDRRKQG